MRNECVDSSESKQRTTLRETTWVSKADKTPGRTPVPPEGTEERNFTFPTGVASCLQEVEQC
jgi:hypothetical protein